MARARRRFEWAQTAALLSMAEAARMHDVPFDGRKWLPDDLQERPAPRAPTKREIKAFSGFLNG